HVAPGRSGQGQVALPAHLVQGAGQVDEGGTVVPAGGDDAAGPLSSQHRPRLGGEGVADAAHSLVAEGSLEELHRAQDGSTPDPAHAALLANGGETTASVRLVL